MRILFFSLLTFSIFICVHFIHFRFFELNVILNECILDIMITIIIVYIVNIIFKVHSFKFFVILSIIFSSISLNYIILFPVMIDRSISVHMLVDIYAQSKDPIKKDDVKYFDLDIGNKIIDRRIDDFLSEGLLEKLSDDEFGKTNKGYLVYWIYSKNNDFLNLKDFEIELP